MRSEQAEVKRLIWALVLSLAFHLLIFGTHYVGKQLGWWANWQWPAWMQGHKMLTELIKKEPPDPASKNAQEDYPLLFLEVSPAQETAEPPKTAQYYAERNSQAANPQADRETDTPRIDGTQTHVAKTEDVVTPKPVETLQPVAPPPDPVPIETRPVEQVENQVKPAEAPGDLTMSKPEEKTEKEPTKAARPRPRTLVEAKARNNPDQKPEQRILGEKMKQEGGVKRKLQMTSLDAKASPFGSYDAAVIEAISARWYALLYERSYASDSRGKVVLRFQLHYDGRVTDMNMAENSSSEMLGLICQKAVLDPAPFAVWPTEMRRVLGEVRNIQFTFYYN